jgi:hypothetical protein
MVFGCVTPKPREVPEPFPKVADGPSSSNDPEDPDAMNVKEKRPEGATVTHEVCHPSSPTGERPVLPEADVGIGKPVGGPPEEESGPLAPFAHYGCTSE